MDQPTHADRTETYVERTETHVMPWHFKAEDAENGRDCVLIATMLGDEMLTISLHAGHLPDDSLELT